MKRDEFMPQFERLCKGFKLEPTIEQAEAWYRRIGHVGLAPWAEAVTTLLCAKYFPKLDEALDEVEKEADRLRKAAVEREKFGAKKTYTLIQSGQIGPRQPDTSVPLFKAIKAYAGRDQARRQIVLARARLARGEDTDQSGRAIERRIAEWTQAEQTYTQELVTLAEQLTPEENQQLLEKYEAA